MIRKLVPFLTAAALALGGCASTLDATATATNAGNVRALNETVAKLHVKAGSDASIANADAQFGQSAQTLADAMAKDAAK